MRATGIVRQVDRLGRIVIPMEIRKKFDMIDDEDSFEIFVEDDKIILKKYQPGCLFCGETEGTVTLKGHVVCKECTKKLSELATSDF
ncbi:MAG: AbrB/MazE/SpoVT family DNA-binding domain-containing protein [Clostridia bacterium]|nr:AbrB/MazE/SpoVT family DNA-binding domain-containing protein [Clostridia bacterium]MBQ2273919.1 AbrB/MazE/SpoVT family DNA-binding domain-containing protein [Clostridia bacterium]MBQ5900700.1 AbrB/MazE/SpoVT family DNA-binding domain-containing protein [Clostridia bacterium]